MSLTLLHPSDIRVPKATTRTASAFKMGPQIHPSRAAYEFYPTPPEATRALLAAETFHGSIWEPACGTGWIAEELKAAGYATIATDLVDYGYGTPDRDFLAERTALARNIITNPPYGRGLGDAFAKHAIQLTAQTGGKVAMLLPIHSLCHPSRHPFFERYRPATVYALDECHCWPNGDQRQATKSLKAQRYCWIVWDHAHQGHTRLSWLSTAPFRASTVDRRASIRLL
jgi:hypothetical protein